MGLGTLESLEQKAESPPKAGFPEGRIIPSQCADGSELSRGQV